MSFPVLLGLFAGAAVLAAFSSDDDPAPNPDRRKRASKTERKVCRSMGREHLGGPGRADCDGGIEVKDWARKMSAYDVRKEAQKGRKIIVATGGFTDGARDEARSWGVRLRKA